MNAVHIHIKVLRAPAVVARLRKFECAAAFVDWVPYADRQEANRLCAINQKLQEELMGDTASPAFAIVHPDFSDPSHPEWRKPLAKAELQDISDEATVVRLLDEALVRWGQSRAPEQESPLQRTRHSKDSAGRIHVEMTDQPDNLVLLVSHPEVIEPELTRGRWLVLVYSLLSSDSVRAAYNSPGLARQLAGFARVAIRPTMHFDETKKWLPDYERVAQKGHPFWVVIEDGIAIRRFEGWMDNDQAADFAQGLR